LIHLSRTWWTVAIRVSSGRVKASTDSTITSCHNAFPSKTKRSNKSTSSCIRTSTN